MIRVFKDMTVFQLAYKLDLHPSMFILHYSSVTCVPIIHTAYYTIPYGWTFSRVEHFVRFCLI